MTNECLYKRLLDHRKYLHSIPEVGRKEFETSKYIKSELDKMNIGYEDCLSTGAIGIIRGKDPKKTIAFRADIDALTSEEGPKHLCGHDGHTSILLGLVEYLNFNRDRLNDNIVFIFQPAEEGPGGAEEIIKQGTLKKYDVDEIYGLHIYPEIPQGKIGIKSGYFMARIGDIDIKIISKSGHGAMPQSSVDGILIAADFITAIQSIVSRNVSPIENAVITIGKINGGSRRNIIAGNVEMQGTMRTFKSETYETMKGRLRDISRGFETAYNCKIKLDIKDDYISVKNDHKMYLEFIEALGKENVVELEPLMISEDFSYYQREVPGLFFMLGSRNEAKGFINSLHNIKFDFDEKLMINAIEIYKKLLQHKKALE